MAFEPKNSQISLLLMAIALILVGVVLFSEAAWWQAEGTTVETNSDKTYQTDTKQAMGTYQISYSVDWGPNMSEVLESSYCMEPIAFSLLKSMFEPLLTKTEVEYIILHLIGNR